MQREKTIQGLSFEKQKNESKIDFRIQTLIKLNLKKTLILCYWVLSSFKGPGMRHSEFFLKKEFNVYKDMGRMEFPS